MIHVHLTAAERIVAASAAVGSAAAMVVAPSLDWNLIVSGVVGAIVSSSISGMILIFINRRLNAVHTSVVEVAKSVNGLHEAAVAKEKQMGQALVAAAQEVGAATTLAAHAEGHLEGVVAEQERGVKEQIRVAEAKRDEPPPADPKTKK